MKVINKYEILFIPLCRSIAHQQNILTMTKNNIRERAEDNIRERAQYYHTIRGRHKIIILTIELMVLTTPKVLPIQLFWAK